MSAGHLFGARYVMMDSHHSHSVVYRENLFCEFAILNVFATVVWMEEGVSPLDDVYAVKMAAVNLSCDRYAQFSIKERTQTVK